MLEVSNLEVVYNSVMLVLKGVSIAIPEGQIVALLGPNGAGKTTLLRSLTSLLDIHEGKATKGSVTWRGFDLLDRKPEDIVKMGVSQVMEGRRILSELTVEENLRAGAYLSGEGDEKMESFYTRFPILGDRRKQLAGYLSGGEQQMLAIARALMANPELLLLDEPSLGLAPKIVEDVAALVRELNQDGMTVLLVEQNASMALDLADHGYILENGKVVLDGTAEALKADKDIQEFYLGLGSGESKSYRDVKHYKRRKRWLS